MAEAPIALGWRVHSWWAVLVAVRGPVDSPVVVHRERVTLLDDAAVREPYHVATGRPIEEAPAFIESVEQTAVAAAEAAVRGFVATLGSVAAVGIVGGNRKLPDDLRRILSSHALLHASERDLYERALVQGTTQAGLPVSTLPATGTLFDDASRMVGVALKPALAALGKSIGPPWQKDHKEATAAALVALEGLTRDRGPGR